MANGKAGAPVGNRNGNKNKVWSDMLRLIVTQDKRKRMRAAAEALVSRLISSFAAITNLWVIGLPRLILTRGDRIDAHSLIPAR